MAKLKSILDFDFDDYNEETKVRLCLEVPCVVNLAHCNVIPWFERQVKKKVTKKSKWQVYKNNRNLVRFLEVRGAFLYNKYLEPRVGDLKRYNRWILRRTVWTVYFKQDSEYDSSGTSIVTIIDTGELLDYNDLSQAPASPISAGSTNSFPFEYDFEEVITSTQQTQPENS